VHKRDRQFGKGGSVILYAHNSLHSLPCSALSSLEISDYTWYTVNLNNSDIYTPSGMNISISKLQSK